MRHFLKNPLSESGHATALAPRPFGSTRLTCRLRLMVLLWAVSAWAAPAADAPVKVTVHGNRSAGQLNINPRYTNTSLRQAPPPALAERVVREYGKPAITRCWLCLDDMWDYRTGEYHFNYQIGKNTYAGDTVKHAYDRWRVSQTDVMFHDYLDAFSRNSDEIMLNVRRYEHEVTGNIISLEKWKEVFKTGLKHYRLRCPNLRYIEVLNESNVNHFGGLKPKQYYRFYQVANQAINELNDELKLDPPLLIGGDSHVGGPASGPVTGPATLAPFLYFYARDPNPRKRLDFVSFHSYAVANEPARIARWEGEVDAICRKLGLAAPERIFITEIGCAPPEPNGDLNRAQAAGMTAFLYQARQARRMRLFPWVLYHGPVQLSLVQFDGGLRMTPFGAAMKMLSLHKTRELTVESAAFQKSGKGLGALASSDESGLVVELWNFSERPVTVEVELRGLPAPLRSGPLVLRQYLIDSRHSNCFAPGAGEPGLEMIKETPLNAGAPGTLNVQLEPNALCLWVLGRR